MQLLTFIKTAIILLNIQFSGSIYDLNITTIEGTNKSMSDFKGKKIVILILPVSSSSEDLNFFRKLDSLSRAYEKTYSFIGVPSYEYGYSDNAVESVKLTLRSVIGSQVTITQGLFAKKSSAKKQNSLFSWLTDANQNTHFDQEVKGIGEQYFINEDGELFAVFGPEMSLSGQLIEEMSARQSQ